MNEIYQLTGIYHEVQEGSLCAQHALNNLLQREIFSAIPLAEIARNIDEQERSVLGHRSGESENMDDTGFFSIQVLQKALEVFDLELIPYASQHPAAQQARIDPQSVQAYICNLREHWLTIRRFGTQYFDLNSVSTVPKLVSNTYLSLYLAQLQQSGYSIFIVHGNLPPCLADEKLANNIIDPTYYTSLTTRVDRQNADTQSRNSKNSPGKHSSFDEKEIQRALKESADLDNADDRALQQVLAQSLREIQGVDAPILLNHAGEDTETLNQKLLDEAIAASLNNNAPVTKQDNQPTEPSPPSEPTIEELRQRRLQFFNNKEKPTTEENPPESNK